MEFNSVDAELPAYFYSQKYSHIYKFLKIYKKYYFDSISHFCKFPFLMLKKIL